MVNQKLNIIRVRLTLVNRGYITPQMEGCYWTCVNNTRIEVTPNVLAIVYKFIENNNYKFHPLRISKY